MKKNFTLAAIILIFTATTGYAQARLGIRAGLNLATWKGDAAKSLNDLVNVTNGYAETQGKTAFYAGGFVRIPVTDFFSIEPGVSYSQKGYALRGNFEIDKLEFLGANAMIDVQSHYIDIPVLLKVSPAKGFNIYAGPQLSYLVKNNLQLDAGVLGFSLLNRTIDITEQFNRFDWSIAGGLEYEFDNGFSINAGYDHGLSRLDKNSNFKSYNRVIKAGIGFRL